MTTHHFAGELTARDAKRTLPHPFTVPPGCTAVEIDFRFSPSGAFGVENNITLTLFDPRGFRGAGHRSGTRHTVRITPDAATPGYLPGPLPPGAWIVEIDTHMVMPGTPVTYTLDVDTAGVPGGASATATYGAPPRALAVDGPHPGLPDIHAARVALARRVPGPRWYRGDFHCHSAHSDADGFTVPQVVAAAHAAGLDFIFLTDHNTTAGLAEMDAALRAAAAATEPSGTGAPLLATGGIELTTFWGHALCLGTRAWIDWRVAPGTGGMSRIAEAVYAAGQLFVIAHPGSPGDPACTGCAWRFGEMMPTGARLVEVWNGPWAGDSNNESSLALFYDWLNQGLRLVATAGTDAHSPAALAPSLAGRPTGASQADGGTTPGSVPVTAAAQAVEAHAASPLLPGFNVVYAEALSDEALFGAVRAGHLYLSSGPRLTLEADVGGGRPMGGGRAMMGDTIADAADMGVSWDACPPGAEVRVLLNGRLRSRHPANRAGSYRWRLTPVDASWVLVEIRAADGALLALTNPIFLRY